MSLVHRTAITLREEMREQRSRKMTNWAIRGAIELTRCSTASRNRRMVRPQKPAGVMAKA